MARLLEHRGPDEEGFFVNRAEVDGWDRSAPLRGRLREGGGGHVGFAHRRLAIIDLATGQQPLSNERGDVWISFNGEIYNFPALHDELAAKGHRFRTRSDTEMIVHAYEEWGERCVERFRGMFAFAIWDEPRQRLYLARDRVGKKPLYYAEHGGRFLFASEIKALLAWEDLPREVDPVALSDYLSLLYVPAPLSIFRAVRKLPAAHWAVVTRDAMRVQPYWDLSFEPATEAREEEIEERLLEILSEATRIRMMSEVPLGAFLSGGVDSSAVVACMARHSATPVKTSSIAFGVRAYDESEHARRVAALFRTDHSEYRVEPEAVPVVERLAWHYDEPHADSSQVPTYYVSRTAREKVTVALSGDGGDENFAGYRRYWFDLRENRVRSLVPAFLRRPLFGLAGKLYPKADWLPQIFRGKAFLSNVARDPVEAYFHSVSCFKEDDKRGLLRPELLEKVGEHRTSELFHRYYRAARAADHLSRIQYVDVKTYLCEDILVKVDRASMAVSLEVRCPLLDHELMEYAARIPARLKIRGREKKAVFKRALRRVLPGDVLDRPKMGFGVPIREWLRGEVREYARGLVLEGGATREFLRRESVEGLWREHQSGLRDRATELWALLMLNLWHRTFAGAPARSERAASGVG